MPVYIAHDERSLDWKPAELNEFEELWNSGEPLHDIAKKLNRPQIEIALIILDRADKGHINPREGGVFGNAFKSKS
ncbi:hypothetical protein SAMN05421676_102334 [Salinibacillus kushneri]|uniref:Helix-turn-helix domain-containing protein n=1 Tax=Salinibacillus kushneri TaxID=237682 RepID=A0A1I0B4R2_9BACI|nr:hypothetical protein [Salinibacillus kushneri]SET00980.1 hypothetical protein SAMN05421676_102334 [Salinibacillus kushneri]